VKYYKNRECLEVMILKSLQRKKETEEKKSKVESQIIKLKEIINTKKSDIKST